MCSFWILLLGYTLYSYLWGLEYFAWLTSNLQELIVKAWLVYAITSKEAYTYVSSVWPLVGFLLRVHYLIPSTWPLIYFKVSIIFKGLFLFLYISWAPYDHLKRVEGFSYFQLHFISSGWIILCKAVYNSLFIPVDCW